MTHERSYPAVTPQGNFSAMAGAPEAGADRYKSGPWLIVHGHGLASEDRANDIARQCAERGVDHEMSTIDEVTPNKDLLRSFHGLVIVLPSVNGPSRASALQRVAEFVKAYRATRNDGLTPLLDGSRRWFEVGVIQLFGDDRVVDGELRLVEHMVDRHHRLRNGDAVDPFAAYASGDRFGPPDTRAGQAPFVRSVSKLRTNLDSWGLRWELTEMAELLNRSSFGGEATRSLRDRSPWETGEQTSTRLIALDLRTLVVAMRPVTDLELEPNYQQILSLCQVPISVAEVGAMADLPLTVVKVLLSDLINQRLILFRLPATPTAEPSERDGRQTQAATSPDTASIDTDRDRALAASGFARLPARWQEVLYWTDVEGLSVADAAPILGLPAHEVAALARRARQSLTQSYTWARLDNDDTQQPENQDPCGHNQSFGDLLRKIRRAAGISLSELARRIHYSKAQLSKIENGHKPPTLLFAKLCDSELGTDGVLAAAIPARPKSADAASPDEVCIPGFNEFGSMHSALLPREECADDTGALLDFAVNNRKRPLVDAQTLAALRASFDQYRLLGTMTSPATVLCQVIAHVHTLRTLAADNPEPMRTELLLLAARVAEYAGWLCQEAGREADALHWLDLAVTLVGGRDPHLAGFVLFRKAELALYRHDPHQTVELARRAQADRAAGPRILGLAASCEAQGHALLGNVRGYEEALDRAAALLAIRAEIDDPILDSTSLPDEIALVRGWSLYELGRPAAAAELLDAQLAVLPLSARRARVRFGIRRALAHATNGAIDQACDAAGQVVPDLTQVESLTCRLDLRELSRALNRRSTDPTVRDLQRKLTILQDAQS